VAPLRLGGYGGSRVPLALAGRYRCSLNGRRAGAARSAQTTFEAGDQATVHSSFLLVDGIRTYAWICLLIGKVAETPEFI
jgi:hypothetical protein